MPVVITCPACQKKARVPDAMLGQPVKCPACGAMFSAPANGTPADPATTPAAETVIAERPLPADADALRAARTSVGVQLCAQLVLATALALFLVMLLSLLSDSLFGGPSRPGRPSVIAAYLVLAGAVSLLVGGLLNLAGAGIGVLAPPARLARGLAVATLAVSVVAVIQIITSLQWSTMMLLEGAAVRWNGSFMPLPFHGFVILWVVEVVRVVVLTLYWRALSSILRDARGATNAQRLTVAAPVVQVGYVGAWAVVGATAGAAAEMLLSLGLVGWLALQLILTAFTVQVAVRLRRRLRAVVPDR
jgi:hypothetical protein